MKIKLAFLALNFGLYSFGQNCSMFSNGKYFVEYDSSDQKTDSIEIYKDRYFTFENGLRKEHKIKMLSDCSFQLENDEKIDESKFTELQKLLAKQKVFFEITNTESNVYFFVCRVNFHIECGRGKFIRKK